jgi:6-pyruvoyltetrahydropterin/6-carboxytetrahydropterin synthase
VGGQEWPPAAEYQRFESILMLLTRKAEFSASHVCANPSLSDAENREIYGFNANPRGHGHNFVLEVTIEGDPDPVTGMVFDLRALKEIINAEIVDPMDHRFLNHEVPPFDRVVPTTENIAVEIWKRLEHRIQSLHLQASNARLKNVRLYETTDLFVDYGGESLQTVRA